MKVKRFTALLLILILCIGMISASAEEVYPDMMQNGEVEVEVENKVENETETEQDAVTEEETETESEHETMIVETDTEREQEKTEQLQQINMLDSVLVKKTYLAGDLKICLGYPDNRYFTGTASGEGGVHWKTASPTENLNSPSNWWWLMEGWYDTYGSACYFNANGSPNNGPASSGLVIAKYNTSYTNVFFNCAQYKELNPDLAGMTDAEAWAHWLQYGMAEGRRTSYIFHPAQYKTLYGDLSAAFGNNYPTYYQHYAQTGRAENRWGNYATMYFNANGGSCSTASMLTSYGMPVGTTPTVHNTASLPTPTRDGYIFEGWYTGNNEAITAGMNCYWINDLTVYAHWKEIGKATVTVNHYKQNVSGNGYTLAATESVSGSIGSSTTPAVKKYTGFTAPKTQTVTIPKGGTSVNYYYSRNKYSVTVNTDNGIAAASGAGTYYYGAAVSVAITPKAGYKINSVTASSGISNPYNFTMPAGNVTITATSTMSDVTVTVPLCLIAGESDTSFVITSDNTGGIVTIEVPETLQFIQENKEQVINGNIQLSANTLTADRHQITGTVTTERFSAGSWKASFNINIKYQAE